MQTVSFKIRALKLPNHIGKLNEGTEITTCLHTFAWHGHCLGDLFQVMNI